MLELYSTKMVRLSYKSLSPFHPTSKALIKSKSSLFMKRKCIHITNNNLVRVVMAISNLRRSITNCHFYHL